MNNGNGHSGDAFLIAAQQLKREVVDIPEIGQSVTIQELSWERATALETQLKPDDPDLLLRWFIAAVIDPETGDPRYADADLPAIRKASPSVIVQVARRAIKLTKIHPEEAEKNSEASPA